MSSSNGVFAHQRNAHHARTMLKRRSDKRDSGIGFGDFQEDRIRYAPPQKRQRSQTQTQSQSADPGVIPLYHGSNVSRFSNYGDVIRSNSSNSFPFALRNNDSSPSINTDHQKPFGFRNPNPQFDLSFDSLPEWVPNRSNFPIKCSNFVADTNRDLTGVRFNAQAPVFTNVSNSMPVTHSNMISIVSQAMTQPPIVSNDLSDFLCVLNSKKEKQNSIESDESPLGIDFDQAKFNVRHESVIKSLYSDMPRQCSSCGVRFKCQEDHSNHMDWHVRKNRMLKEGTKSNTRISQKPKKSREWFASSSLWLRAATGGATGAATAYFNANGESQKKNEVEEEQKFLVLADENQKTCALCLEPFEEFFSHEEDEWMYKDAVYLKIKELGPIVHAKCMPEPRKGPAKDSREAMVMSVTVPTVGHALAC